MSASKSGDRKLIVISGGLTSGKSVLARRLAKDIGCHVVKTREVIRTLLPNTKDDRPSLQRAGNRLDRATRHRRTCGTPRTDPTPT